MAVVGLVPRPSTLHPPRACLVGKESLVNGLASWRISAGMYMYAELVKVQLLDKFMETLYNIIIMLQSQSQ